MKRISIELTKQQWIMVNNALTRYAIYKAEQGTHDGKMTALVAGDIKDLIHNAFFPELAKDNE